MTLHTNMRLLTEFRDDVLQRKAFSKWVLCIGDDTISEDNGVDISLEILDDFLIKSSGDSISSIAHDIYPSFLKNMNDPSFFQDRAILARRILFINNYMLSLIPSEEKIYLSFDYLISTNPDVDSPNDGHTLEFLNMRLLLLVFQIKC